MDVSIIIVSFNTKKLTLSCIDSIEKTAEKIKYEIIVVDNNSKDGSLEALGNLEEKNKIKLIGNRKNLGFSKASNQGIKASRGKHVLLLNSDAAVKPNAIMRLFEFAEKHKDAGVVGARLLNSDGSIQPSCLNFPTLKNAVRQYWFGEEGKFDKYAPNTNEPIEVDVVVGACFLITKKALQEVGMLDERYFFYYEDLDYCRKVKRNGLKVYYLPSAEVVHYHGASGAKVTGNENQWRRLIPSSKIYHGYLKHLLITFVLWTGQKWGSILKK